MKGERILAPAERIDFGEALVPPEGYRLEAAIGTTFSMDIATALTVPVAMALRGGIERDELVENPLAALAAMQRLQDRVRIFLEAGNIHPPAGKRNSLISLLEGLVVEVEPPKGSTFHPKLPSHIAARFAANAAKDGEGGQTRLDTLREAFNSPFRPFVLASTSVGQEGLDFHHYCHRIWHWNLPGSPTDLEQREGRVQRYLNHAVRRNIATCQVAAARETDGPAWSAMLAAAVEEVEDLGISRLGMCPHWLYTGNLDAPALIESILPLPPFSREAGLTPWLIKTTALYRLAFGQPRQSDLLAILETAASQEIQSLMIRLAPGNFTYVPDSDCDKLQGDEQHEIP